MATCRAQIPVPQHRMTPLKEAWLKLYEPVTQNMKLDMRMNLKSKKVRGGAPLPKNGSAVTSMTPHASCQRLVLLTCIRSA